MILKPLLVLVISRRDYWRNRSMEENGNEVVCRSRHSKECERYAEFLSKPLKLSMLKGKAKLFEGFSSPRDWSAEHSEKYLLLNGEWFCYHNQIGDRKGFLTIGDLVGLELTLTPLAIKEIGFTF